MYHHPFRDDPQEKYKRDYVQEHCRIQSELLHDGESSWRIFKIMSEFVAGFDLLQRYGLAASVFGSARSTPDDANYQEAYRMGELLAKEGFAVITGGGPGVMEAANRGAYDAGGQSVGLNIKLPHEQALNQYVTETETFHYFFSRKVSLSFASEVYIYFPGGFGTMDEFFEILTLVQTGKIENIPIVLVGKEFWTPLLDTIRETMLDKARTISPEDVHLYKLVDNADEAIELIKELIPCEACREAEAQSLEEESRE